MADGSAGGGGHAAASAGRAEAEPTTSTDAGGPVQTAHRPAPGTDSGPGATDPDDDGVPAIDPINANPQRFLGADGNGLTARLGPPTRRRVEASARVWQYRLSQCVLDVVLYPRNGSIRAVHIEARDRDGEAMPTRRCLHALLARTRGAPSTSE